MLEFCIVSSSLCLCESALLQTEVSLLICKMSADTCSHYGRSHVTRRTVDRNMLIVEALLATRFALCVCVCARARVPDCEYVHIFSLCVKVGQRDSEG